MTKINNDELIKSLVEVGIPEDEARDMILKGDEQDSEEQGKEKEEDDEVEKGKKKKEKNNDLEKSLENHFSDLEIMFDDKFNQIQKSVEIIETLNEEINMLKGEVNSLKKETPLPKSFNLSNQFIIEKAVNEGISSEGMTYLSQSVHKEQIGNMLAELYDETEGELQKSLEMDLTNFVGGTSELGKVSKRLLKEKRNIIIK